MDESEILKFEHEVKPMKFSEAIRIGSRIRPQTVGRLFRDGGSCVIGAAAEANGMPYSEGASFGELHEFSRKICMEFEDADFAYKSRHGVETWRQNDSGITREVIADRLEALGF